MTESILTKLAVVVKDYSAYFKKNLNIFFAVKISTSVNNNYSTLGGKVQANTYRLENTYVLLNHQLTPDEKMILKYFSVGPSLSFL